MLENVGVKSNDAMRSTSEARGIDGSSDYAANKKRRQRTRTNGDSVMLSGDDIHMEASMAWRAVWGGRGGGGRKRFHIAGGGKISGSRSFFSVFLFLSFFYSKTSTSSARTNFGFGFILFVRRQSVSLLHHKASQ